MPDIDSGVATRVTAETVTRTVLFTDMVGSTQLRSQLGDALVDTIRRAHDARFSELIGAHGGAVVKGTGDGVMAAFQSAGNACACAVAIQQSVERDRRRRELPVEIRVGLSTGDVSCEDDDYF